MDQKAKSIIKILLINDKQKREIFAKKLNYHSFFEGFDFKDLLEKKVKPHFIPKLDNSHDLDYFPELN